jgi:hypothetical protein
VAVKLTVKEGLHVQANPAATEPKLIPTVLTVSAKNGITVGEMSYPKGKPYRVQSLKTEIPVYSGTFEISVPLEASASAKYGKTQLLGKVHYQACDDVQCFFPTNLEVKIPVVVR